MSELKMVETDQETVSKFPACFTTCCYMRFSQIAGSLFSRRPLEPQYKIASRENHAIAITTRRRRHDIHSRRDCMLSWAPIALNSFLRVSKMRLVIIVQKYCSIFTRRSEHSRNINFSSFILREAPTGASDSPSLKKGEVW